eukprot:2954115-Prymnesium_polylepis.1
MMRACCPMSLARWCVIAHSLTLGLHYLPKRSAFAHPSLSLVRLASQIRVQVPLAKGAPLRTPQILSLEKFAEYCDKDVIVATNVDDSEVELEGSYWLALLSGPAFALDEDTLHSGQLYRKGWIVALGRWYKLRQRSERGYELLPSEALLVVNHTIFLKGLAFTGSQSGPQDRRLRQTATGPLRLSAQRARASLSSVRIRTTLCVAHKGLTREWLCIVPGLT